MIKTIKLTIGLKVLYHGVLGPKGLKSNTIETTITSTPWKLGHGAWVVKIKDVIGAVSLDHIELIT